MGCAASSPRTGPHSTQQTSAPPVSVEDPKTRELRLKAEASAASLTAMMAEVEAEKERERANFIKADGSPLIAALQRHWYGAIMPIRDQQYESLLTIAMSIAACDSTTAIELQWFKDRTLLLGLSAEQTTKLLRFDFRLASVEALLKTFSDSSASVPAAESGFDIRRLAYYDALSMANSDMYSLDERARASNVGEMLGLTRQDAEEVEAVVAEEEGLLRRKLSVFNVTEKDVDSFIKDRGQDSFKAREQDSSAPQKREPLSKAQESLRPKRQAFHSLV